MALDFPKLGELVAFRNIISEIPKKSAVDEASIEAILTQKGYHLYYCDDAIVRNRGPDNIKDFLIQRRRIYAGHIWLEKIQNYTVPTKNSFRIIKYLLDDLKWTPKYVLWTSLAVWLEAYGRLLGWWDFYILKKNPFIWDIAESTKRVAMEEAKEKDNNVN